MEGRVELERDGRLVADVQVQAGPAPPDHPDRPAVPLDELEDDLAEAKRHADDERAARARIELDAVVDELSRATNRFGRARAFSSTNERARTAVQKAVRRALDHVAHEDQALGALLRASVRTGRTCCYDPTPGAPRPLDRPDAGLAPESRVLARQ